jgi:integrase
MEINNPVRLSTQMKFHQQEKLLFEKDIWKAEEIGYKPDSVHGIYHLNFKKLNPVWFKLAVKRFIRFQSATKSFASCYSYIVGLNHFGNFITENFKDILPEKIDRRFIVKYIEFLTKTKLGLVARSMALIHLRTFHWIMVQEKWLSWPKEPLVYSSDLPKNVGNIPCFIPEVVITQLQQNLCHLLPYMQNLVTILLETGRRIGEICTLCIDCMEQDQEGDYFLRVYEHKLKKAYLIPISEACVNAIKAQQANIRKEKSTKNEHLFPPGKNAKKTPHISARNVHTALNKLAEAQKIKDANGHIWHFHSHQFRHTVGTRMINAGVPQTIVQKYLGHESPEMTARYAHIHDATLKSAFNEYSGKLVDIQGKSLYHENQSGYEEAKWLQHNLMTQALPNGICALPFLQQRCPHANACLTCAHFRTHKEFLPQHLSQLEKTDKIIETSKTHGWQRQLEMNIEVKNNLEKIIKNLQEDEI